MQLKLKKFSRRKVLPLRGYYKFKIHIPAENYILLDFGNIIDEELNRYIMALMSEIKHEAIIELIPAYSSLLMEFNQELADSREIIAYIKKLKPIVSVTGSALHEIPVKYDGANGPDLEFVAANAGLSKSEVIKRHTANEYRVYMLGFLPGFCYLGGLDPKLACKRMDSPRLVVPAGSVGIAGNQTGIYPSQSPGGWRIIGRTDLIMYKADSEDSFPIKPGDRIRFVAVDDD